MKLLLLDERYPPELLTGFEVVRAPEDDVVAVLTIRESVGPELFAQLPALRVVGTATVGFDHIDIDAAEERSVAVVSVPDYCTQEAADHTLALLYALVRGVVALDQDVRRGRWNPRAAGALRTIAEAASGRNAGFLLAGVAENFVAACRRYGEKNALAVWRTQTKSHKRQRVGADHVRSLLQALTCRPVLDGHKAFRGRCGAITHGWRDSHVISFDSDLSG